MLCNEWLVRVVHCATGVRYKRIKHVFDYPAVPKKGPSVRSVLLVASAQFLVVFMACSRQPSSLINVSGTIRREGEPLKNATVMFIPDDDQDAMVATGITDSHGRYALTTEGVGHGVMRGRYVVTIHVRKVGNPFEEVLPDRFSSRHRSVLRAPVSDACDLSFDIPAD